VQLPLQLHHAAQAHARRRASRVGTQQGAINSIPVRIIIFYVLALATIMVVTPWRDVVADKSPFVELFLIAGLPAAGRHADLPDSSLMQAFTLITTLSALLFMFVWSIILLSYLAYRKSRQALYLASG
jgi:L-asparagine transporter-like permease